MTPLELLPAPAAPVVGHSTPAEPAAAALRTLLPPGLRKLPGPWEQPRAVSLSAGERPVEITLTAGQASGPHTRPAGCEGPVAQAVRAVPAAWHMPPPGRKARCTSSLAPPLALLLAPAAPVVGHGMPTEPAAAALRTLLPLGLRKRPRAVALAARHASSGGGRRVGSTLIAGQQASGPHTKPAGCEVPVAQALRDSALRALPPLGLRRMPGP